MSRLGKYAIRVVEFTVVTTVAYGVAMACSSRFNLRECLVALGISFVIGLVLALIIDLVENRKGKNQQ